MFLQILTQLLAAASAAGLSLAGVLAWFVAHLPQIEQAIADVAAGKGIEVVVADLLALFKQEAPKKGVACAKDCCCKDVCVNAANAILAVHTDDCKCAAKYLATALVATLACCDGDC